MIKRDIVTVGQIYTLLFISRISLSVIYSVLVSGMENIWELFLPLIICIPVSILLLVPVNFGKKSVCIQAVEKFGKIGYAIPVLYGIYFLFSGVYAIKALEHFLNIVLPEGINARVVTVGLIIAGIYAAVKGIEALSRMAAVVLGFILLSSAIMFIYLVQGFSGENILPVEYVTFGSITDGVVFIISRMNTSAALNVLLPSAKGRLWKSAVIYSVLVFLFMCFMLILLRGAVGDYINSRELSVYQAIEGAGTLQRLKPLFIFVTMCSLFCNISVMLFAVSESVKGIFRKSHRKIISVISGIFLIVLVLVIPENEIIFDKYVWCILTVIFTAIIPLIIKMPKITAMFLALAILGGCNSMQLNQRLIVQGIGIDRNGDGYKITLIVLDTDNKDKENSVKLVYAEGKTVKKALYELENQRGKKLLLSQCLFVMMDRNAVSECRKTLSYFGEAPEMQKTANLMVTDGTAEKTILTAIDKLGYQSEYINVLADSRAVNQTEVHCSLVNYISSLKGTETALLFPYIMVNNDIKALSVKGSYLVDGGENYYLTSDETVGTLILNEKVTNFTDNIGDVSYEIKSLKSEIIPEWTDGRFEIEFSVELETDKRFKEIPERVESLVNSAIKKTILKSGADVFSIGKNIRGAYPELYKNLDMKNILKKSLIKLKITCCT